MGDRRKTSTSCSIDDKLKLEFHGVKIMSDAGLLAFREPDEAFRLTERGNALLSDCRQGKNTQHTILALLPQGVYGDWPATKMSTTLIACALIPPCVKLWILNSRHTLRLLRFSTLTRRRISAHFSKSANTFDGPRYLHAESKSRVA